MKVTKVTFSSVSPREQGVCAVCSVVLDGCLVIKDILVLKGVKGLYVAMPNNGYTTGVSGVRRYIDIVYPCTKSLNNHINSECISAYENEIQNLSNF